MKKKEPRWYILWYFTAAMWFVTLLVNISNGSKPNWIVAVQFLNIVVSFAAGIINGRRYKNRQ